MVKYLMGFEVVLSHMKETNLSEMYWKLFGCDWHLCGRHWYQQRTGKCF